MATVKIKGRMETIQVSNERAIKLKALWRGDPRMRVAPAPRTDVIDLGSWTGEIGQIASVETDRAEISETLNENEVLKVLKGLEEYRGRKETRGTHFKKTVFASDLYLESLGVIRFDEWGSMIVRDVNGYGRMEKLISAAKDRMERVNFGKLKAAKQVAELAGVL